MSSYENKKSYLESLPMLKVTLELNQERFSATGDKNGLNQEDKDCQQDEVVALEGKGKSSTTLTERVVT